MQLPKSMIVVLTKFDLFNVQIVLDRVVEADSEVEVFEANLHPFRLKLFGHILQVLADELLLLASIESQLVWHVFVHKVKGTFVL